MEEVYSVLGDIHSSSGCVLRKAKHRTSGDIVVVKSYTDRTQASVEIQALSQLQGHRNICTLREVTESEHDVNLVLDYYSTNLQKLIYSHAHGIPPAEAKPLAAQILNGLSFVHDQQVAYLALRPSRVMIKIAENGKHIVKLVHFKRACPMGARKQASGAACWSAKLMRYDTPELLHHCKYDAPELLAGDVASTATDIWAFGCTLAEMLTGKPLFQGNGPAVVLANVMQIVGVPSQRQLSVMRDRPALKSLLKNLGSCPADHNESGLVKRFQYAVKDDQPLLEVLLSCLQMDPQRRPTARQLLQHKAFAAVPGNTLAMPVAALQAAAGQELHSQKSTSLLANDAGAPAQQEVPAQRVASGKLRRVSNVITKLLNVGDSFARAGAQAGLAAGALQPRMKMTFDDRGQHPAQAAPPSSSNEQPQARPRVGPRLSMEPDQQSRPSSSVPGVRLGMNPELRGSLNGREYGAVRSYSDIGVDPSSRMLGSEGPSCPWPNVGLTNRHLLGSRGSFRGHSEYGAMERHGSGFHSPMMEGGGAAAGSGYSRLKPRLSMDPELPSYAVLAARGSTGHAPEPASHRGSDGSCSEGAHPPLKLMHSHSHGRAGTMSTFRIYMEHAADTNHAEHAGPGAGEVAPVAASSIMQMNLLSRQVGGVLLEDTQSESIPGDRQSKEQEAMSQLESSSIQGQGQGLQGRQGLAVLVHASRLASGGSVSPGADISASSQKQSLSPPATHGVTQQKLATTAEAWLAAHLPGTAAGTSEHGLSLARNPSAEAGDRTRFAQHVAELHKQPAAAEHEGGSAGGLRPTPPPYPLLRLSSFQSSAPPSPASPGGNADGIRQPHSGMHTPSTPQSPLNPHPPTTMKHVASDPSMQGGLSRSDTPERSPRDPALPPRPTPRHSLLSRSSFKVPVASPPMSRNSSFGHNEGSPHSAAGDGFFSPTSQPRASPGAQPRLSPTAQQPGHTLGSQPRVSPGAQSSGHSTGTQPRVSPGTQSGLSAAMQPGTGPAVQLSQYSPGQLLPSSVLHVRSSAGGLLSFSSQLLPSGRSRKSLEISREPGELPSAAATVAVGQPDLIMRSDGCYSVGSEDGGETKGAAAELSSAPSSRLAQWLSQGYAKGAKLMPYEAAFD